MRRKAALHALWLCLVLLGQFPGLARGETITVASKNFEESRLLAEMFAQLLEDRTDLTVERRLNLAGTKLCFDGLQTGAVDVYPEYTGTGLVTLLEADVVTDPAEALVIVRREFLSRWNLVWGEPLGFENAYEMAVLGSIAREHNLRTISDLVPLAPELTAGVGFEFAQREDGLPGLERLYGLKFGDVKEMQQTLKYEVAGNGQIDSLDVYTTDGKLSVYDLVVLEDDKLFFPPYEAVPLMNGETVERHPEIVTTLALLGGRMDAERMRGWNRRLEAPQLDPVELVAHEALMELGLVTVEREITAVSSRDKTLFEYLWANRAELTARTVEHLGLSALAVVLGVAVALPLGLFLERNRRIAEPVIRTISITQTIPSIALLAFMLPFFSEVGWKPAVMALWIYSIFPILRNTYSGLRDAPAHVVSAASALGMTDGQVLQHVRLPLAAPVIMAGIRTAAVITVGTATLAAFIGAGGLGREIVAGLQLNNTTIILSGALPAAALAVLVDAALALVERAVRPKGVL